MTKYIQMGTKSYAIWNNKGGVGKSTITFHLASRYAEEHPEENVLVIDLCPQSNVSMMLLGGGSIGEDRVLKLCTSATPATVVGYLSTVIGGGAGAPLPRPMDFIKNVHTYNKRMPDNLFLMSGDGNLEPMAPAISQAANAPALTPTTIPWLWIHRIFRELIKGVDASTKGKKSWMVFIDTNPSFSIYTELAVSAADRLIVPVNADDSSRVATNAMFVLLHGQNPPHPIYGSWTYATRASQTGLQIPTVHLVVGNRLTSYSGVAAAFEALSDATADTLFSNYQTHPQYFAPRKVVPKNAKQFRKEYSVPLRDFNTAGVVSAHLGRSLSDLPQGNYPVHAQEVGVKADQVLAAREAVDEIVSLL